MTTEPSATELTTTFARIHGMLLSREASTHAVHQLAQVARDLIGSAAGAGVSLLETDGQKMTTAATDRLVEAADALQYEIGEGPCLSAWATATVQRIDDTAVDTHWPVWSAAAARLGVRSMLSTPLVVRGDTLGALKVYATTPGAFTVEDEHMLGLLAGAAATLLSAGQSTDAPHRLSAALQEALTDRQSTDMAVGILMERRDLEQAPARALLLETARTSGRPLLEIARQILDRTTDPTR
jgi:GAF domain-containing protein